MDYITRISYNGSRWHQPTGDARKYEQGNSYNKKFGFGHEDWLFRDEWEIDGWRYAFLQGVNKSLNRLQKVNQPFSVRLFCVEPDRRRRYVADIDGVECLSEAHADEALEAFKKRGWFAQMKREISAVKGDASALGRADYATYILNVRYRLSALRLFPAGTYAPADDPVRRFNRYSFIGLENTRAKFIAKHRTRVGSELPPSVRPFTREISAGRMEISPAHSLMQARLMVELRREFPKAKVVREKDFIDVSVTTPKECMLFEIKSDLSPSGTIRQALGQLLEYLYRVQLTDRRQASLVIVGRSALSQPERAYFDWLKSNVAVPLSYRVVKI